MSPAGWVQGAPGGAWGVLLLVLPAEMRYCFRMDLEQANLVLELKPGAGFRQVSEAREDLLALWNPNRISDHPRLRAKAARKIEEINQAYAVLMEHLGQGAVRETAAPEGVPKPAPPGGPGETPRAAPVSGDQRASLYEEVFSNRRQRNQRRVAVWSIAGGALLLVLGLILYAWWGREEVVVSSGVAASEELPSVPPVAPPPGETALEETATAPAVDAPAQAVEEKPPAVQEVAALPRPKPPPVAPHRAPRPPPETPGKASPRPALKRESGNARPAAAGPAAEESGSEAEQRQRAEQFERVFRDLLANSAEARKLVDGQVPDLGFAGWTVVNQTETEIWIELVAQKPDGESVHCTWAINPANGATRALSAAARSLERSGQVR